MKSLKLGTALIILAALFLQQCSRPENPQLVFSLAEKDLIPEGIAYSKSEQALFLGSIAKQKIVRVDVASGQVRDFVKTGIIGIKVLGLCADDARGRLWACAYGEKGDGPHRSAIFCFDLKSGDLIRKYETEDTLRFTNNDLCVDARGTVYYTDNEGASVYRIPEGASEAELLCHGTEIEGANGIALSPDGKYLYVASTSLGIRVLNPQTGDILNKVPDHLNSKGIDGMEYHRGWLIGMQNDVDSSDKVRLVRYRLNADGSDIVAEETLDRAHPLYSIPTTFDLDGDRLYLLANSQLQHWRSGQVIAPEDLEETMILRYLLP